MSGTECSSNYGRARRPFSHEFEVMDRYMSECGGACKRTLLDAVGSENVVRTIDLRGKHGWKIDYEQNTVGNGPLPRKMTRTRRKIRK